MKSHSIDNIRYSVLVQDLSGQLEMDCIEGKSREAPLYTDRRLTERERVKLALDALYGGVK